MSIIKNKNELAINNNRKIVLDIVEKGLEAISPKKVLGEKLKVSGNQLTIAKKEYNLSECERVFLVGAGKGSAENSKIAEEKLGEFLTTGWVIDIQERISFSKIKYTKGTHPLPSETNRKFTQEIVDELSGLTEKDLVIFIICGGGSAMLFLPYSVTTKRFIEISKQLLKSGANIEEMNTVRKHLSKVKGGEMAKILYPAKVAGLIFSDVPGDDIAVAASGPLVKDEKTTEYAKKIIKKYGIDVKNDELKETVKEDKYFNNVEHIMILSNQTSLEAMQRAAETKGIGVRMYSSAISGNAKNVAEKLLQETKKGQMLIAGGETTVNAKGGGKGGRNQELVLWAIGNVQGDEIIVSINSDGWDNTEFAGAIGDKLTIEKAKNLNLNPQKYLEENDSYNFFNRVGDGIITGRLPSNVSDLMVVYKP